MASQGIVQAEVFGDSHLIATMNSWAMRAGHAEPAYEAMHQYAMELEKELFETEGASGEHGAWEGHKEGSRSEKDSKSVLRRTDDLFNSLTDANDANHRFVLTPYGFAMGTALSYAEFIQTGTKNMAQRRLFDWTWPQRMGFVEIMHEWITRAGLSPTGQSAGFRVRSTRRGRFIG